MSKKQYLELLKKPFDQWTLAECHEADRLIKQTALAEFDKKVQPFQMEPIAKQFLLDMARCHFGCVEVDQMLTQLDCYPEWLQLRRTV
jgi:hypothetical protein